MQKSYVKQKPRIFKARTYISNKTGWSVFFDKDGMWYTLNLRNSGGVLMDKCRCDTYSEALAVWRDYKRQADIAQACYR